MAFFAPLTDSIVRLMRSGRQGDSTWIATSSGIAPGVSTRRLVKSKSVWEAEGKETSISLNPISQSILKKRHFSSPFCYSKDHQPVAQTNRRDAKSIALSKYWQRKIHTIGSGLLWLPSRRLVSSHRGAFSIVFEGHCRLGKLRGGKGLYFFQGSLSLGLGEYKVSVAYSIQHTVHQCKRTTEQRTWAS